MWLIWLNLYSGFILYLESFVYGGLIKSFIGCCWWFKRVKYLRVFFLIILKFFVYLLSCLMWLIRVWGYYWEVSFLLCLFVWSIFVLFVRMFFCLVWFFIIVWKVSLIFVLNFLLSNFFIFFFVKWKVWIWEYNFLVLLEKIVC